MIFNDLHLQFIRYSYYSFKIFNIYTANGSVTPLQQGAISQAGAQTGIQAGVTGTAGAGAGAAAGAQTELITDTYVIGNAGLESQVGVTLGITGTHVMTSGEAQGTTITGLFTHAFFHNKTLVYIYPPLGINALIFAKKKDLIDPEGFALKSE